MLRSRLFFISLMLSVVWFGLAACANQSPPPTEAAPVAASPAPIPQPVLAVTGPYAPSAEDYRIGPQDLLELQVFSVEALNRTVRVNSRGYVSLPLVGLVQAAGLTSEQLEESLSEKLSKEYLQNPQVSVFIKEFISQRVTVEGEVKKPGVYPLKGRLTLLQVLATAEGLTTVADPEAVKVFRTDQASGKRETLQFDLEKIRIGQVQDPAVRNDDIVQVGKSRGKAVAKELIEFILPFRVLPGFL
ncbi:MAG: polysaccharide biosynthesis/export family protein [Candidatus Contendobacter sp.]